MFDGWARNKPITSVGTFYAASHIYTNGAHVTTLCIARFAPRKPRLQQTELMLRLSLMALSTQ